MAGHHHALTSDHRAIQRQWIELGGQIVAVRRTGEIRYAHPAFLKSVRVNCRRADAPAIILSRISQLLKAA